MTLGHSTGLSDTSSAINIQFGACSKPYIFIDSGTSDLLFNDPVFPKSRSPSAEETMQLATPTTDTTMSSHKSQPFEQRLFINNEFVDAKSGEFLTVYNPVDNSITSSEVHSAGPEDVDLAVAAARQAFKTWSVSLPIQRQKALLKFADLLEENADEMARLEAICAGKSVTTFKAFELPLAANTIRYYAGWCDKIEGESFPAEGGFLRIVRQEPLGVCAAVNAFNGPTVMMAFKAAPAVASGNTIIIKSSEKTPLSCLFAARLVKEAGFPPGVINFISGGGATGALLSQHMGINKISFTGSVATGKKIAKAAAESNLKRVTLELGGKSPSIIFPDANMEVAVQWCTLGITMNAGQACIASSRVYVHESIKDKFVSAMKVAFEATYGGFGDPFDKNTVNVPLVDKLQFDKVSKFIEIGKKEGLLVTGGEPLFEQGCWMKPTIFVDTKEDAVIYKEEIFGPVVVIKTFSSEDEVIGLANDTEFGLSGAVFSQDINLALRVAGRIHSGTVGINCCTMVDHTVPFGGFKQSGAGRELGKYGIRAYTEPKTIFVNMTY